AWPVFDPKLALRLLIITGVVLYLPKLLALLLAMREDTLRNGCGGMAGLLKSFIAETILSILLSPIMMLVQTRFVIDILLGRDSGWNVQNRSEENLPFGIALKQHAQHMLAGLLLGTMAFIISWDAFLWFTPI